ncbi:MAG: DUF1345 domain-containing protein [Sphingomonas sp.]|uniref:DUF1345 domain-containing protein n=1 Tax=Sphingomonas sp. TaxID=28214 RepID=UPI0018049B8F|nr:DUF1345 domain-containing protein [Sphingomonas sp.]MBA3668102.1 DUF1345 domain-containing protein [Sphingomonas sp.]
MTKAKSIANRFMPWRFLLFFVLLVIGWAVAVPMVGWAEGLLLGFDGAAIGFLASNLSTFSYDAKRMRDVAKVNDANRAQLLVISFLLSVIILAAVIAELSSPESLHLLDKLLVAVSLVLVWTFGNAVYTLHYAHLFYTSDDGGKDLAGLDFPKTKEPLISDFAYFAFTLGVAVQTSDVCITSPHIRKIVTAHCVAGFFFNLGVLALTINVLASG